MSLVILLLSPNSYSEELLYYSFDEDGDRKKYGTRTAMLIEPLEPALKGYAGGKASLGDLSEYGHMNINGRAIFRFRSLQNQRLGIEKISTDIEISSQVSNIDSFKVILNGSELLSKPSMETGQHAINIELDNPVKGRCFVLEFRGHIEEFAGTIAATIDNLSVEGSRERLEVRRNRPCWERRIGKWNVLVFYDFENVDEPTYNHPALLWGEVKTNSGTVSTRAGGYVEETGIHDKNGIFLEPTEAGELPNFFKFSTSLSENDKLNVREVKVRAIGLGARRHLTKQKMELRINGEVISKKDIDGIMREYTFKVSKKFEKELDIELAIWNPSERGRGAVIDEFTVTGHLLDYNPNYRLDVDSH